MSQVTIEIYCADQACLKRLAEAELPNGFSRHRLVNATEAIGDAEFIERVVFTVASIVGSVALQELVTHIRVKLRDCKAKTVRINDRPVSIESGEIARVILEELQKQDQRDNAETRRDDSPANPCDDG